MRTNSISAAERFTSSGSSSGSPPTKPHSKLLFSFDARAARQKWVPALLRLLRKSGYPDCSFKKGILGVTALEKDGMETAVRVASMASFAYEGDVRFWKVGCGKNCEYRIELFPLG